MWCYEHHAEITAMVNDTTHVLIQSQESQQTRVLSYFMWMDASPGPSTPQSHSPGTSSRPSHSPRSAQNLGVAECSNSGILHEIYQGMRNLNME
ncbi:hypothetical protein Tco_0434542 [Tanacetum coccineum]